MSAPRVTIVVPCYNEERRLQPEGFASLVEDDGWSLLFVDDGSTDGTAAVLEAMRKRDPTRISVLSLEHNVGKSEAVRRGLVWALEAGAHIVGYYDADLATPPADLRRIVAATADPKVQVVLGARVALLGREIQRSMTRHLLGRVFATLASVSLDMAVYDTQCGAKALRATDALREALATPFHSKWIFDVELMSRLRARGLGVDAFVEVPVHRWQDVRGSKLTARAMVRSVGELARVAWEFRRR